MRKEHFMKPRKAFALVLTALLLLGINACSQDPQEDVTYYMKELVHTYTDGQTSRSVYEYNEDWSTRSITTYENEDLYSTITYEMTETGYITRGTAPDGTAETMEVVITRDENDNILRTEQYVNGELSTTAEYTYDENGSMLTYSANVIDAGMSLRQEFTYDSRGNKIKVVADSGYGITTTEYTYDAQNRLVKESSPDSPSRTEYTYEDGGKLETASIYDENGELFGKRITTYDDHGNMLLREIFDANGELMMSTACSYIGTDGSTSSGIAG